MPVTLVNLERVFKDLCQLLLSELPRRELSYTALGETILV